MGWRAGTRRRRPWSTVLVVLALAAVAALVGWRLPGGMFAAAPDTDGTDDTDEASQPVATSAGTDPSPASPPPAPAVPAPRVGECRTLGWDEAATEWEEVVARPDIHIVDIATPGDLHAPIAIAAAARDPVAELQEG